MCIYIYINIVINAQWSRFFARARYPSTSLSSENLVTRWTENNAMRTSRRELRRTRERRIMKCVSAQHTYYPYRLNGFNTSCAHKPIGIVPFCVYIRVHVTRPIFYVRRRCTYGAIIWSRVTPTHNYDRENQNVDFWLSNGNVFNSIVNRFDT